MAKRRALGRPPKFRPMNQADMAIKLTRLLNFDSSGLELGQFVVWHHGGPWDTPRLGQIIEVVPRGQTPKLKRYMTVRRRRSERKYIGRHDRSYLIKCLNNMGGVVTYWPDPRRLLPCESLEITDEQRTQLSQVLRSPDPVPPDGILVDWRTRKGLDIRGPAR